MESTNVDSQRRAIGLWSRLGDLIEGFRRFVANALFLLFMLILCALVLGRCQVQGLPAKGALVLNPAGAVVEVPQSQDPIQGFLSPALALGEVAISDLVRAVDAAATDDRIPVLLLRLDELGYVSLTHAEQLGDALLRFRAAGKRVEAYGVSFNQISYLLASHADAVYLHPMGQLLMPGLSAQRLYWRALADRSGVDFNVFRAGEYKSYVEPFLRQDMSAAVREETQGILETVWTRIVDRIAENRQLPPANVRRYGEHFAEALAATNGDAARAALEANLVDELLTLDERQSRFAEHVGRAPNGDALGTAFDHYLASIGPPEQRSGPQVAVLRLEGAIVASAPAGGAIGAEQVIEQLRAAADDSDVRALVVRVNSPGGSSTASELIRQRLELLQITGKPVVVSMGPTAASGGYWISATADEIVAEASTVTGSIGAFSVLPNLAPALSKLAIGYDGVVTSPYSTMFNPLTPLTAEARSVLQQTLEQTYEQFTTLVARGRALSPSEVEPLAGGRIWTGLDARERGLVDSIGGLDAAVERAAALAELDRYGVRDLTRTASASGPLMRLVQRLLQLSAPFGEGTRPSMTAETLAAALADSWAPHGQALADLALLVQTQPKGHSISYCELCSGL